MIHKVAVHLANKSVGFEVCSEMELEVYIYGFEMLLSKIIFYPMLILMGILLKAPFQMVTYLLFVFMLRGQTGGYHAKTHWGCTCLTCMICILALLLCKLTISLAYIFFVLFAVVSISYIIMKAPINHVNLALTEYEIDHQRKLSRRILLVEMLLILVFIFFPVTWNLILPALLAITTVAATMILAKITNQEVPNHEKLKQD